MKKFLRPELGAAVLFALAIGAFLAGLAYAMSLPATHPYVVHMARVASITPTPGSYSQGMAWTAGGWIYMNYDPPGGNSCMPCDQVWRIRMDGTGLERVTLPEDPVCAWTSYHYPSVLPDGRIELAEECNPRAGRMDLYRNYLLAFDPATGKLQHLMATDIERLNAGDVSWAPGLQLGAISEGSGMSGGFAWITPRGLELVGHDLQDGTDVIHNDGQMTDSGSGSCAHQGMAVGAKFSPSGRGVAFWGTGSSVHACDFSALDTPSDLLLMEGPSSTKTTLLVRGVRYAAGLAWSPDGKWLAFSGDIGSATTANPGQGDPGQTWLLNVKSGRLIQVWDRHPQRVTWSPDCRHLAALTDEARTLDDIDHQNMIRSLDVSGDSHGCQPLGDVAQVTEPGRRQVLEVPQAGWWRPHVSVEMTTSAGAEKFKESVAVNSEYCHVDTDGRLDISFNTTFGSGPVRLLLTTTASPTQDGLGSDTVISVVEREPAGRAWSNYDGKRTGGVTRFTKTPGHIVGTTDFEAIPQMPGTGPALTFHLSFDCQGYADQL